jgi:hippurate hydrolase
LFQPAEEGPGGALPMIKEGCLDQIDEVYGYHNIPNFDEGDIRVCPGPFFANSTQVLITITGQGGHGSAPHKITDPITAATMIHTALNSIKSRNIDSRQNIVFSICQI